MTPATWICVLSGSLRLADALNHLYVLLPVLDDSKHYWVSTDEVDKLVRAGEGWLAGHPEKALITRRYLAHRSSLYNSALARLAEVDDAEPESFDNAVPDPDQEPDGETGLIVAVATGLDSAGAVSRERPMRRSRWPSSAAGRCSQCCARPARTASPTSAAGRAR